MKWPPASSRKSILLNVWTKHPSTWPRRSGLYVYIYKASHTTYIYIYIHIYIYMYLHTHNTTLYIYRHDLLLGLVGPLRGVLWPGSSPHGHAVRVAQLDQLRPLGPHRGHRHHRVGVRALETLSLERRSEGKYLYLSSDVSIDLSIYLSIYVCVGPFRPHCGHRHHRVGVRALETLSLGGWGAGGVNLAIHLCVYQYLGFTGSHHLVGVRAL